MLIAIWDLNLDPMVTLQVFSAITPPLVAEHFPRSPFADFKNFKAVGRLRLGREDIAKFMGTPPKRILANPSRYVEGRRVWVDLKEAQLRALTRQHFRTHLVRLIFRYWAKKGSGCEEGWNTVSTKRMDG